MNGMCAGYGNGDGVLDMSVGADGDDDGKARSGAVYVLVMKNLSS